MKVGVISDTHGLLRPEAVSALAGVEQIIHAGDIGSAEVLAALAELAPVTAITGNIDYQQPWAEAIPTYREFELAGWQITLLHDRNELPEGTRGRSADLVISGHSHQPGWQPADRPTSVAWLNPGSAGPRRFSLPVCLALVELGAIRIEVEIIELTLR